MNQINKIEYLKNFYNSLIEENVILDKLTGRYSDLEIQISGSCTCR